MQVKQKECLHPVNIPLYGASFMSSIQMTHSSIPGDSGGLTMDFTPLGDLHAASFFGWHATKILDVDDDEDPTESISLIPSTSFFDSVITLGISTISEEKLTEGTEPLRVFISSKVLVSGSPTLHVI